MESAIELLRRNVKPGLLVEVDADLDPRLVARVIKEVPHRADSAPAVGFAHPGGIGDGDGQSDGAAAAMGLLRCALAPARFPQP